MTEKQAEELVKKNLVDYLTRMGHIPDNAGRYHCISADHVDGNPSMTIEKNGKYAKCWSHPQPHDTFNIFDAIGMVEGIRTLHAQKSRAFEIYHIEIDDAGKETTSARSEKIPKAAQASPPVATHPVPAVPATYTQPDQPAKSELVISAAPFEPAARAAELVEPEPVEPAAPVIAMNVERSAIPEIVEINPEVPLIKQVVETEMAVSPALEAAAEDTTQVEPALEPEPEESRSGLTEIPDTILEHDSMADYLNQHCMAVYMNDFTAVIHNPMNHPAVLTGFSELDKLLDGGLYPGLYVVCSRPAEGKTTFVLQMADYMIAHDQDALLISLDQTKLEVAAKSLSRLTLLMDDTIAKNNARTTREMMDISHKLPQTFSEQVFIDKAIEHHRQSAQFLYFFEFFSPISMVDIQSMINHHMTLTGHFPIVILDSLQYVKPAESGQSDNLNADQSVRALMQISRACNIPIIALSGVIRDTYGSDVILSMQMEPAAGTLSTPHQVELRILKNRHGPTGGKVSFHYYSAYNYFEVVKPGQAE